jgi:hypothetical protein
MDDDGKREGIFSLARRREIERERHEARRRAFADAKRVLGRLTHERRVLEAQAELVRAERAVWDKQSSERVLSLKIAALKEQLRRLLSEDGPAAIGAAEDVARAIEGCVPERSERQPPDAAHASGVGVHRNGTNGAKSRSPWG